MTITPGQFVANYPEFADATNYPVSSIQMWLDLAYQQMDPTVWNTLLDTAAQWFTAHFLVEEYQASVQASKGAPPGTTVGSISSKSVGPVSVGYDVATGVDPQDGFWSSTVYGRRLAFFVRLVGCAGAYVGPYGGCQPPINGPAWPGPYTQPSPTGFGT